MDDRHEQAAVGVDGDAEVLGLVVGDRAGGLVDARVDHRVRLEGLDGGQGEERQEDSLTPSRASNAALACAAQPGDAGDVDLDDGRELRARPAATRPCAAAMTLRSRDSFSVLPRTLVFGAASTAWLTYAGAGALGVLRRLRDLPACCRCAGGLGGGAGAAAGAAAGSACRRALAARRRARPACGCGRRRRCPAAVDRSTPCSVASLRTSGRDVRALAARGGPTGLRPGPARSRPGLRQRAAPGAAGARPPAARRGLRLGLRRRARAPARLGLRLGLGLRRAPPARRPAAALARRR